METDGAQKDLKNRKKKRGFLRIVLSLILVAVVSVVTATLVNSGGRLDLTAFTRLFNGPEDKPQAAEFSFDAGSGGVFAELDGGLAVCTAVGLQVFDKSAQLSYRETFEMANPTVCTGGGIAAVYDLGGTALRVFDTQGVLQSVATADGIISASINKNGWLALCTREPGYKGSVSIYSPKDYAPDQYVYKWYSGEGYVLAARLLDDNKNLAVLTLGADGGRVVFLTLDSEAARASATLPGALLLDIRQLDAGRVLAVGEQSLQIVSDDGGSAVVLDYSDKYLSGFALDGDVFSAFVLSDYLVGDQGRLVTVDRSGKIIAEADAGGRALSISAAGSHLAVLYSDGLVLYDKNLTERARVDDTAGAIRVIVRPDGSALLIRPHSAILLADPANPPPQ